MHGHFVLPNVAFGKAELLLTKAEYEDYRWTVDFGEISQVVYVQIADGSQFFDADADLLERELKQPALALKHLEAAQSLRYDPEVDLRIRKLGE